METHRSMICSICKQEVQWYPQKQISEETPIGMGCIKCGSVFHISHINSWLEFENHCPFCLHTQDQNGYELLFNSTITNSEVWMKGSPDDIESDEIDTILKNPALKGSKLTTVPDHWSESVTPYVGLFFGLFLAIKIVENIDIDYLWRLELIFRIVIFFIVVYLGNTLVMKFFGTGYLEKMIIGSESKKPSKLAYFQKADFLNDNHTMRWKITYFSKVIVVFLILVLIIRSIDTSL